MSSIVCPCVTATDAHAYREQMARVAPFAQRLHIDFSDGVLAPVKLINPIQAYWPEGMLADLHLMIKNPQEHLETVISLRPNMVILHAEADGDLLSVMRQLRAANIKTGVALLQQTQPDAVHELIADADHVLIFSGDLGHFGGTADMTLLKKVGQIRAINANVEIGWDGGIRLENAAQLALGGVEVLDVGGSIQQAPDPQEAYATLVKNLPKEVSEE
jgi:ribulose-phosphate 3-epimerase